MMSIDPVLVVPGLVVLSSVGVPRNHTSSIAPQAATVVVAPCGVPLPTVFPIYFQATSRRLIGSGTPQDATTTVAACGATLPTW
jgi:hypothetical protein